MRHLRRWVQILFTAATNSYLAGFIQGRIYRGGAKHICVPGLNCYSCPGALGSCPIGALQTTLASMKARFSWYAAGTIALFGAAAGRFVCGWLCPFGLFQELLYKLPGKKRDIPYTAAGTPRGSSPWRYLKYLVGLVFVLLLPMLIRSDAGLGETWFCAYICPAGTVEAAIPLLLSNEGLRSLIGWRFILKAAIASLIIIASYAESRPFCKYLCPLGAAYGMCNSFSVMTLEIDHDICILCGACQKVCPMDLDPVSELSRRECIRCGRCKDICLVEAINWKSVLAFTESRSPDHP